MKRRIVLGIDCWYPQVDGVTNVVHNYQKGLEKENECVTVAPSYGTKLDSEGEEVYCKGVFRNRSLKVPFLGYRNSTPGKDQKLKKMLDGFKPDVLHAHSPFAISKFFYKYGKKNGIPVVYTFHSKFEDDIYRITHSRLVTSIVMKVIMRNINRMDYVWAVSGYAAQALHDYGYDGNVKVVPNATDMSVIGQERRNELARRIDEEYGFSPNDVIFLYVGRVVKVKNLQFSFDVVAELKRRGFDCKFLIVGGEDIKEHKAMVEKCGIEDRVIFTGCAFDREKLSAYYARANLFLMPSTFDTYGLVVVEAAACGTPTLAAARSCSAEMIENGKTGYVEELEVPLWVDRIEKIFRGEEPCGDCSSLAVGWEERMEEVRAAYEEVIEDYRAVHCAKSDG